MTPAEPMHILLSASRDVTTNRILLPLPVMPVKMSKNGRPLPERATEHVHSIEQDGRNLSDFEPQKYQLKRRNGFV